jgi:haloalkane dehalogenase
MDNKVVDVLESKMHYIEEGGGDPILFLHGVPTSSYAWQNVIPHLSILGRCIAVDLIGFGKSGKPNIEYSITDHIRHIEAFIQTLNLKRITLVMHGWGSIVGFNYAMHNQNNCKGLVFYESYIRPVTQEDFLLPMHELLRSSSDKPLQTYLQELPSDNNITNKLIDAYSNPLQKSQLPKLMIYSVPGFITSIATVMWAKEHLSNLEIIEIGENDLVMMGESISIWLQAIEQACTTRNT